MIIHDFDVLGPGAGPPEYDRPLIVDPDCMFACEVAFERFKLISGRYRQVPENTSIVQLDQLPASYFGEWLRKAFRYLAVRKYRKAFRNHSPK